MRKSKPSKDGSNPSTSSSPEMANIESKEAQQATPRQSSLRPGRHKRDNRQSISASNRLDKNKYGRKRQRTSFRAGLAVLGGRAAGALSRRLHLGGGTSITGVIAQSIYPDIVGHLAIQLEYGSIMVTGTNGKTTTSGFIAAILSDAGLRVWRNKEGSNLMRGLAGALVIRAHPNGRLRRAGRAISIFETDEAVVPQVVGVAPPRVAVFTNLFRDQLDRYGEVDTVAARWREAIKMLPDSTTLVLNADDPTIAHLGESFTGSVLYFGVDDPWLDLAAQDSSSKRHQVIDTRTCPHCGGDYTYTLRFYSHMGHYSCPNCGLTRPQPAVRATKVHTDSFDRLRIEVETPSTRGEVVIPLPGLYNVYNALAAITAAQALQLPWDAIVSGIEQYKPAFGRGERVHAEGRTVRLLLAKNPTGFNEVLRTLFNEGTPRHVLFVLNDNIADGRDISWIWDVDFERAVNLTKTLVVAGTRALDLALRLKYASIDQAQMTIVAPAPLRAARQVSKAGAQFIGFHRKPRREEADEQALKSSTTPAPITGYGIAEALDVAIRQTPEGETLFIVPTYTGLLEIHRELERRGLTPHYWEEPGP